MVEDDEIITWDFTYDSKDRLTSINHAEKYNGRTDRYITNYTWSNNVIKAEDGNSTRTYTLNNNLVKVLVIQTITTGAMQHLLIIHPIS